MASTKRDAGREAFWRDVLRRQAGSGLSVRAFCRRDKLGGSNLYAWRRTIAQRDQEKASSTKRKGKAKRPKSSPAFVPVAVKGRLEDEAGIIIELDGWRRLRLNEAIEPERLASIVHALEAEAVS